MTVQTLQVALGARSYDILAGPRLITQAEDYIAPVVKRPKVFILSDDNVAPHYLGPLQASLDRGGITHDHLVLPAGEATKDVAHLDQVLKAMLDAKLERSSTLIALGGGVIGDLGGFAASVYLRGIDFIQVPTTLLSQVDSSVGGKTGINMPHGKNLVGAFHQPRLVLADTESLQTLPKREVMAGYAEVVKYGLLGDEAFFTWLEQNGQDVVALDGQPDSQTALSQAILQSCAMKARIVEDDERESGKRALLNLGHTFGHALEAAYGYGILLHGEAVAMGMVMAFEASVALGHCPAGDVARIKAHYQATGLPIRPPATDKNAADLVALMATDKKVEAGVITFVMAKGIGQAYLDRDVPLDVVETVVADALKEAQ